MMVLCGMEWNHHHQEKNDNDDDHHHVTLLQGTAYQFTYITSHFANKNLKGKK